MIYIKKGPPPRSVALKISEIKRDPQWKEIPVTRPVEKSQQKGYGDTLRGYFDQLPKEQIRASLLTEQHYLCAYCMRRLPNAGAVKIEHWFPLSEARDTAIEYTNFLGSCSGDYSDGRRVCSCCDDNKGGHRITIDPRKEAMMDCICYESNGTIYFDASKWNDKSQKDQIDDDINNVLCLNGKESELTIARERVYHSCTETLKRLHVKNKCSISAVQKLVEEIERQQEYPEYAGVMLFFYKRWLRNHSN